jgi:hypothetical protein
MVIEFKGFQKIARYSREVIVTEKIDGTNAQIFIANKDTLPASDYNDPIIASKDSLIMCAGSRNRFISLEHDNYGFAKWVQENADELFELGPGRHFGEWWGAGIQRRYDQTEKHWSLFNVHTWLENYDNGKPLCPKCCNVVPIIWRGNFDDFCAEEWMTFLYGFGSKAAPGYMNPEGIVIYHSASGALFKKTFENDETGKGENV